MTSKNIPQKARRGGTRRSGCHVLCVDVESHLVPWDLKYSERSFNARHMEGRRRPRLPVPVLERSWTNTMGKGVGPLKNPPGAQKILSKSLKNFPPNTNFEKY